MRPLDPSLMRALPGARGALVRLAGVGVVSGVVALVQALSVAWMVTALVREEPLRGPLAVLAILLVARGVLAGLGEILARHAGHQVSGEVRKRLLERWLDSTPEQRPTHDEAVSLAGVGASSLEPYVSRYLPAIVTASVVPALVVVVMFVVDPWSALIVVVTLPLLPLFAALIGMHTADESARRWDAMHLLAGHFLDVVRGLPTLVSYGRAARQVDTISAVGDRHRRASVRALRTAFVSSAALELLATISVAMVAVAVGLRLANGAMDLRVGLMAILLAPEAYWPIRRVGQEFHTAADGGAVLDTVLPELLGEQREHDADASAEALGEAVAPVVVDAVTFGYPDRPSILRGLSVRTPAGPGLTVLAGPSGSGKSTLLDLIAGVRRPSGGSISAGSAHLATQRPLVLPGTVLDALRLGAPTASEHDCRSMLQSVGLWSALSERGGLQTRLGDDGVGLSAGQRTRLSLARAQLSESPLVLLDEPTAHVDADDLDAIRQVVLDIAALKRVVVATHDEALMSLGDSRWNLSPDGSGAPATSPVDVPAVTVTPESEARPSRPADAPSPPNAPSLGWWQRRSVSARVALACLFGGLSMTSGVALTATSGWLIVEASTQPVVLTLLVAIVGVRTFGIARPVLRYAERVVSHDAALETLAQRRVEVYRRLIPLTPARLGRRHRGDLLTAVVTDLDDAVDEQVRVQVPWWSTVLASVAAVLISLVVSPLAAAVVAVGAMCAYAVAHVGSRVERAAQADAVRARGEVRRVTTDLVDRLDQVRAVVGADPDGSAAVVDIVGRAHREQAAGEAALIRSRAVTLSLLWTVLAATVVGVALVVARSLSTSDVSAPIAALVALTPIALADAWVGLAEVGGARARALQAEARLADVLDQTPAVVDDGVVASSTVLPVIATDIRAAWTAEQQPLGPFSLPTLEPGSRVQITGPNGFGKSTMLAVLARQLPPVSGVHLVAGTPATDVRLDDAKADIAVVDDEPHVFNGDIRTNLVLAAPDATDDDLLAALDAADLTAWLHRQPDGLDSQLTGLSGGERTRLAIARAIVSGRSLVLLDEPAAHLDDGTAGRALQSLLTDSTRAVVVVSHQPLPVFDDPVETERLAAAD